MRIISAIFCPKTEINGVTSETILVSSSAHEVMPFFSLNSPFRQWSALLNSDERSDGRSNGRPNGRTDGRTHERSDGRSSKTVGSFREGQWVERWADRPTGGARADQRLRACAHAHDGPSGKKPVEGDIVRPPEPLFMPFCFACIVPFSD